MCWALCKVKKICNNNNNKSSPQKIFHIILGVKSSLIHNLSYFYCSSSVLTGMTWRKQDYFFPIELLDCLTKSILATDCLKA